MNNLDERGSIFGADRHSNRVKEAYQNLAPASLVAGISENYAVDPPERNMLPEEIDPFLSARGQELLARLAVLCDALPETSRSSAFGNPIWKAGKKTFVSASCYCGRFCFQFWAGAERQALLTYDKRYAIPAYTGHNGWVELDVEDGADWREIENLLRFSYRHFALKRMLKALAEDQ